MKCPKCGAEIANDSVFCENCGAKVAKKSHKALWITLIVVVLIGVIGGVIGSQNAGQKEQVTDANTSATTEKLGADEELIYSQGGNCYCNGVYGDEDDSNVMLFYAYLNNLNRQHFRIVFRFRAEEFCYAYPLILSKWWRMLGVNITKDGKVYITTNNQDHSYDTYLTYTPYEDTKIDLEYNHGVIVVNGQTIYVEMDEVNGDNMLSSINYGNGTAFRGNINSVQVYNIYD